MNESYDDEDGDEDDPSCSTSQIDISCSTDTKQIPSSEATEIASKETAAVFWQRALVLVVLLFAAVGVSVAIWLISSNSEEQDFNDSFEGAATKLLDSFEQIIEQKVGALAGLGASYTSYARSRNDTWPLVTINDFQQRAASARSLSDSLFVEILPIVRKENRTAWEEYSVKKKGWLDDGREYQRELGLVFFNDDPLQPFPGNSAIEYVSGDSGQESVIPNQIQAFDETFTATPDRSDGPYFPAWQSSPILAAPLDLVNWNVMTFTNYAPYIKIAAETGEVAIGKIDLSPPGDITNPLFVTSFRAFVLSYAAGKSVEYLGDPFSSVFVPVFDSYDDDKKPVAVLLAVLKWATYFEGVLPPNSKALNVVLENTCEGSFTYQVGADSVEYIGVGDLHDPAYTTMGREGSFDDLVKNTGRNGFKLNQDRCAYTLRVYPTKAFEGDYTSNTPLIMTLAVAMIFVFTACMFFFYDYLVERRQRLVLSTAERTTAMVTSLFPQQVHERLFENFQSGDAVESTKTKLKSFLNDKNGESAQENGDEDFMYKTKPIADLFPATTIMFADIAGFTAWSSAREPSQVFTLLETLYKAFDDIAVRRRVFKVETVGDCYVAATGIPDARKDHAVAMARFARDCMYRMNVLTKKLEVVLGPDTGDLRVRIGLHSGPVTAGVLRGARSRFQLFGDTMNTAARMESTGMGNRIQVSNETADLLKAAGRGTWVRCRDEVVVAKGKGQMQTYWLELTSERTKSDSTANSSANSSAVGGMISTGPSETATQLYSLESGKTRRLVNWNVDVLKGLLKQALARRKVTGGATASRKIVKDDNDTRGQTVIDEVCEIIHLPHFDATIAGNHGDPESIVLSDVVMEQLVDYVTCIAALYQGNPFHNFEHASHVTMSVIKLLSRIVAPSDLDFANGQQASSSLHDHTYGITSDPLTQFACVLSALIHDVDHCGVPNNQLVKENSKAAVVYKGKSVAEQNSVDIAWALLMDVKYSELRAAIYADETEMHRFRQLIVNSVMATDIMDKDLKRLRNARWEKAFSSDATEESSKDAIDRKATIVIEHLIQASDVSHTMQHWHIYRKWNERLFEEMYKSYKEGRAEADPSEFWYKGEIGFFDFYIIPLAKKLKDCGVFGVSSEEYLNYAQKNREEWEARGQQVVCELKEKVERIWADTGEALPETGETGMVPLGPN